MQRVREGGEVPVAEEVDAMVGAAACAVEGEAEAAEGGETKVFVVGAYVGGRGWGEGSLAGVGEEGG